MLRHAAEWFRVVVNTAVDGIVLIDAAGAIRLFNPACEKMFGYDAGEMVGQNVKMLMPEPFLGEHDRYIANYQRTGERKIIGTGRQVLARRKDGTHFPILLSVGEAMQDGKRLYVGTIHDITERRQAETQREQLIEQLVASNEELAHFSHVASHDLQEHLRMVLAFNSLLHDEYGARLDEEAGRYLTLSLNAATQMRALIDDLLEYGGLGSEQERVRAFDAGAELDSVLESLKVAIDDSGAKIEAEALPVLHGNPVRFRRLLQNLIGNAIKYVPANARPHVRIAAQAEDGFWQFRISDNGIGVDPAYFEKIFEPFRRLHGRERYAGSGLGLAICRKIVAGFGGRIWVDSRPGAGANFFFTIRNANQGA